ncbi:cytochrome d ubiquinol oxidase subunit II [Actinoallomurus rhizosphaericola]|uniref:cytochrome d ubiquinol oxidase subunit II n=1 Tax=Actinoallomurus rhizosphaericola TaxID=2952536 RepID=UPI002092551A|nr:cytochrome d ubiquinol oxidase subunit II [Actinoallomurus rhizosphaericola]MCO5994874.1 cytochrome d ubiquinol oxidase subunit II [Actinoallomurus rhizosphaericola]
MDTFAFSLLGFFVVGYFLLAGADIGVGMLLPFLGRDRRLTLAAIAPFFLGNEVWLVASAGLLTALFPALEADLFGRAWGALIVLIAAWILRDTGLWLRGRQAGRTWRRVWDGAIVAGSWGVAASWGATIGVLMGGGGLLFAGTTCGLFALHGAVFAVVRLGTDAARAVARWVVRAALLAGVPCAVGAGTDDLGRTAPVAVALAAVLAGAWIALARPGAAEGRTRDGSARDGRERSGSAPDGPARDGRERSGWTRNGWALAASALAITVVPLLGGLNLPHVSPADDTTLTLTVIGPLVPVLLAAQAWVWWIFRGRVERPSYL